MQVEGIVDRLFVPNCTLSCKNTLSASSRAAIFRRYSCSSAPKIYATGPRETAVAFRHLSFPGSARRALSKNCFYFALCAAYSWQLTPGLKQLSVRGMPQSVGRLNHRPRASGAAVMSQELVTPPPVSKSVSPFVLRHSYEGSCPRTLAQ